MEHNLFLDVPVVLAGLRIVVRVYIRTYQQYYVVLCTSIFFLEFYVLHAEVVAL
jgi:hypothetical protein